KNIPIYKTMADFYNDGGKADIALIATPIKFHTENIITALENGSNVLCEKPLCGDEKDIEKIIEAREKSGKFVYIGYQWSHSSAIEALKKDIMSGKFGKPELLKTLVLWPRNADYFSRGTGWAGKIKDADGALIYDSIANNAAAHYLHNIFYVLGDSLNEAKAPISYKADLYRANKIENFDTAVIRCTFDNGAEALYVASHAINKNLNPVFDYKFEKGRVLFSQDETPSEIADAPLYKKDCINAIMNDGSVTEYGNPFENACRKVYLAADAVRGNGTEYCGVETAAVHTRFINDLQKNAEIKDFDKTRIIVDGKMTYVDGLFEELIKKYDNKSE
ncbi:MAG: Gfo/Idh/MocA family oxidoreductase, partial [Clostridia bacterium]|nr:Gfo/Idh/MocA family oxidoreductase [Clostridia bacterium]